MNSVVSRKMQRRKLQCADYNRRAKEFPDDDQTVGGVGQGLTLKLKK